MIRLCELPQLPAVYEAARKVLESGFYVKGKLAKEFAEKWAERCGMKYGISVGSGAQALELAIKAVFGNIDRFPLRYNNETFKAVPNAINSIGHIATPVQYNLERDLYGLDVYAHHLHNSALKEKQIPFIEDCSHCHGYLPKAETAIFSLFPTKILGACGEAGIIVTNNKNVAEKCLDWSSHGEPNGTNARLDEIQAAVLLAKLPYLDEWIYRRREIVNIYDQAFGQKTPGQYHYMYCISGTQKTVDRLILLGIESKLVYNNPFVAIPLYPEMTDDMVDIVIKAVKKL
jgi:hypothetical protein